ncbi:MAG: hypothetical protein ACLR4Z_01595 [Butyricicoccaceae bacterium]
MMFENRALGARAALGEHHQGGKDDIDGLNYLAGKSVQFVNSKAYQGKLLAHVDGGTPNIVFEIDRADEWHFGYLVYFFEKACGISGYLLGVNPFDQPGVEAYKKMFALLGKKGYEQRKKASGRQNAKRIHNISQEQEDFSALCVTQRTKSRYNTVSLSINSIFRKYGVSRAGRA